MQMGTIWKDNIVNKSFELTDMCMNHIRMQWIEWYTCVTRKNIFVLQNTKFNQSIKKN